MKLILVTLMVALSMASAIEDSTTDLMMVKICGDDLLKAFQEACEQKTINYLLEHGVYHHEEEIKAEHKQKHHEHRHIHDHDHVHDHDHGHDHSHHRQDNHSHAEKKDNDRSISEECCHKPCLVKDFLNYCG